MLVQRARWQAAAGLRRRHERARLAATSRITVAAIERSARGGRVGETYNIGGGDEWRNIDLVRLLCSTLNRRFAEDATLAARFPKCPASAGRPVSDLIEFVTDRLGHDWRYAIDARKVREELGFAPAVRLEEGIAKTVDWYLAHEPWWRSVLSGDYRR